eukprot:TRINITY_DN18629_c0_g1_i1.p1 TRINITY_DN18629_c0_g1~~TRINITY_DN18629_c0_g1_i1.p1  ORF type:complete len:466 (+),score=54.20 TRINITY_DN18629_c0_g1_i1:103-1500(+)
MNCTGILRCPLYADMLRNLSRKTEMRKLTKAIGAPKDSVQCFFQITNETEVVMSDRQVSFFLDEIYDKHNRRLKPSPLEAIPEALRVYETAELVGHLVWQQTTHSMMRICWKANREDTRELLVLVFKRLLAKSVWESRTPNSITAAELLTEMYKMALSAALRKHGTSPADMKIILGTKGVNRTPDVLAVAYSAWKVVNQQMADKTYFEALNTSKPIKIEDFHRFLSHSGSFEVGFSMLRDMGTKSLSPTTKTYNAVLTGVVHVRDIPFVKDKIGKLLKRIKNSGLVPDENTLGLIASIYRTHDMGVEAFEAYTDMKRDFNIVPNRTTLTSIIAAQLKSCGQPSSGGIQRAETVYLEVLKRNLIHEEPLSSAFHHVGHMMKCYAAAGDMRKMELTRDYYSNLPPHDKVNTSSRLTELMKDSYSELFTTLEKRSLDENKSWGGTLHEPWRPHPNTDPNVPKHLEIWP